MEEQHRGEWEAVRRSEGVETGPLPPLDAPGTPQSWAPPPQTPGGPHGYVPPEMPQQGVPYAPYGTAGEPTRQWETPPQAPSPQAPHQARRPQRLPILGPVFLIGLGALFTLNTFEVVPWGIWGQLWRLWPLILIAVGLEMVVGKRNPALSMLIALGLMGVGVGFLYANGGLDDSGRLLRLPLNIPRSDATSATVSIKFGDGDLQLGKMMDEEPLLVGGTLEYHEQVGAPNISVSNAGRDIAAFVDIEERHENSFLSDSKVDWDVLLNPTVSYDLRLTTGASEANLDFSELKITSLDLTMGENSTEITFPEGAGTTTARISGGASNLEINIPESVEARIQVSSGLSNVDVEDRFKQEGNDGNVYISQGYATATNKLDLSLQLGASSVDIKSR